MIYATIPIKSIKDKGRVKDKKKIQSLASSIKGLGLMQPIYIDDKLRLMDGSYRLAAYKLLGLKSIECALNDKDAAKIISKFAKSHTVRITCSKKSRD